MANSLDAYIITMMNNSDSVIGARKVLKSIEETQSRLNPFLLPATVPSTIAKDIDRLEKDIPVVKQFVDYVREHRGLPPFSYPVEPSQNRLDLKTGLYLKSYRANNPLKVVACAVSHYRAWVHCVTTNKPIVILEHDALFVRKFNHVLINPDLNDNSLGIVGLNWAIGATRRSSVYQKLVDQTPSNGFPNVPVPSVNQPGEDPVPQGLAGNSAYYIQPWAAMKLIDKVDEVGLWPNDALICKEFFPWLKQSKVAFTKLQQTKSTTTL